MLIYFDKQIYAVISQKNQYKPIKNTVYYSVTNKIG